MLVLGPLAPRATSACRFYRPHMELCGALTSTEEPYRDEHISFPSHPHESHVAFIHWNRTSPSFRHESLVRPIPHSFFSYVPITVGPNTQEM